MACAAGAAGRSSPAPGSPIGCPSSLPGLMPRSTAQASRASRSAASTVASRIAAGRPGTRGARAASTPPRVAAARWTRPTGFSALPPSGPGDAGDRDREAAAGAGERPGAISRAVAFADRPWSASVASRTPSISTLARLS